MNLKLWENKDGQEPGRKILWLICRIVSRNFSKEKGDLKVYFIQQTTLSYSFAIHPDISHTLEDTVIPNIPTEIKSLPPNINQCSSYSNEENLPLGKIQAGVKKYT